MLESRSKALKTWIWA